MQKKVELEPCYLDPDTGKELKKILGVELYPLEETKELLRVDGYIHSAKKLYRSASEWIQRLERDKKLASENYDLIREENKRLESQNAELLEKIKQLERERDAAIADMRNANICICLVCANFIGRNAAARVNSCKEFGEFRDEDAMNILSCGKFKWRGPCEGNGGVL